MEEGIPTSSGQPNSTKRKTVVGLTKKRKRCAPKHHAFTKGWGKDFFTRYLVIFFWIILVIEIPSYLWALYNVIRWTIGFYKVSLYPVIWMHLIALWFGVGWVPFPILIIDWEKEIRANRRLIYFIYLGGVLISLVLEALSIMGILLYEEDAIYQDWLSETHEALRKGDFPPWLIDLGMGDPILDCCAWHGPLDFGTIINFTDIRGPRDKIARETMDQISLCYNQLFKTYVNGSKIGFQKYRDMEEIPPGCGDQIGLDWLLMSYMIVVTGSLQMFLTICYLIGYTFYPYTFFRNLKRDRHRRASQQKEEHPSLFLLPVPKASVAEPKGKEPSGLQVAVQLPPQAPPVIQSVPSEHKDEGGGGTSTPPPGHPHHRHPHHKKKHTGQSIEMIFNNHENETGEEKAKTHHPARHKEKPKS